MKLSSVFAFIFCLMTGCATTIPGNGISALVDSFLSGDDFAVHAGVLSSADINRLKEEIPQELSRYNTKEKLAGYLNELEGQFVELRERELSSRGHFFETPEEVEQRLRQKIETLGFDPQFFYLELKLVVLAQKYRELYQKNSQ